ncbi:hypothetical protein DFH27DRAFT_635793 [Peziza echinospora]|nr:hypothetical protein DFH27DRAFT_635793 [Peziza echinospora]
MASTRNTPATAAPGIGIGIVGSAGPSSQRPNHNHNNNPLITVVDEEEEEASLSSAPSDSFGFTPSHVQDLDYGDYVVGGSGSGSGRSGGEGEEGEGEGVVGVGVGDTDEDEDEGEGGYGDSEDDGDDESSDDGVVVVRGVKREKVEVEGEGVRRQGQARQVPGISVIEEEEEEEGGEGGVGDDEDGSSGGARLRRKALKANTSPYLDLSPDPKYPGGMATDLLRLGVPRGDGDGGAGAGAGAGKAEITRFYRRNTKSVRIYRDTLRYQVLKRGKEEERGELQGGGLEVGGEKREVREILPHHTVMALIQWVCDAVRPRPEVFGTGLIHNDDDETRREWYAENAVPRKRYTRFALACLQVLEQILLMREHERTAEVNASISWALATFLLATPPPVVWVSLELFDLAQKLMEKYALELRAEVVVYLVLKNMVQPLFLEQTAFRRGIAVGSRAEPDSFPRKKNPETANSQIYTNQEGYPWVYARIETVSVFCWAVGALASPHTDQFALPVPEGQQQHRETIVPPFPPLIIPPILALFDSPFTAPHRQAACEVLVVYLTKLPPHVLAQEFLAEKGLVGLLWQTVLPILHNLPPLTPLTLSEKLLRPAIHALLILSTLFPRPPPLPPQVQNLKLPHIPPEQMRLEMVIRAGGTSPGTSLLPGMQLEILRRAIYPLAGTQLPQLLDITCEALIALLPALHISVVLPELRRLVEVLCVTILSNPFISSVELIARAVRAVMCLLTLTPAWCRIHDDALWVLVVQGLCVVWRRALCGGGTDDGAGVDFLPLPQDAGGGEWADLGRLRGEMQEVVRVMGALLCREELKHGEVVRRKRKKGGRGKWRGKGKGKEVEEEEVEEEDVEVEEKEVWSGKVEWHRMVGGLFELHPVRYRELFEKCEGPAKVV